jgi:hypothetical protein
MRKKRNDKALNRPTISVPCLVSNNRFGEAGPETWGWVPREFTSRGRGLCPRWERASGGAAKQRIRRSRMSQK